MKRVLLSIVILLVLATQTTLAIDANAPGDLQLYIGVSASPAFIEEWINTEPSNPITIKPLRELKIGGVAHIAFIVTGYTRDEHLETDITINVTIRQPDGVPFFEETSYATIKRRGLDERSFVIGDTALDFGTDPGDQLGVWRIEAVAYDHVSGINASARWDLKVIE